MNTIATFRILNPGLFTTVQDLGRWGFQQYGMPVSGAMDTYSLRLANLLVGNNMNDACLEATFLPPEFEIISDTIMAVAGGESELLINDNIADFYSSHYLKIGDIVKINPITKGCRLYIAFAGGIDVPVVMNSRSTYIRAKVGGFKGRALQTGDEVFTFPSKLKFKQRMVHPNLLLNYDVEQNIRVIAGSETNDFSQEGIQTFLNSTYTISNQSDRMGYRLEGPIIEHKQSADIISSGICNGAIQVPGDGHPIIMLADRQTVGGYTKIANVISADLPILGQLRPNDKVNFIQISIEEAHEMLKKQEKLLKKIK